MFKDFEMKNGGHRESFGGHFFCLPPFERGVGGDPPNFSKQFFPQKLLNIIIEKREYRIYKFGYRTKRDGGRTETFSEI